MKFILTEGNYVLSKREYAKGQGKTKEESEEYIRNPYSFKSSDTETFLKIWSSVHINDFQRQSEVKVAQLCPILFNPMDYTVHGIHQTRILEWVAFPFSRGSSQPRDWAQVSCIAGGFFTSWATRETQWFSKNYL